MGRNYQNQKTHKKKKNLTRVKFRWWLRSRPQMTMWYTIPLGMFCNLACVSPSRDSRLHAALCWTDNEWAISPLQRNIIPNNSRRKVVMLTRLPRHLNFCRTRLKGIQNVYKKMFITCFLFIFLEWSGLKSKKIHNILILCVIDGQLL